MVTVALEMHIIMQGGVHPQAAGACHPLSMFTGAGHPAPHVLVHLHFTPHLFALCLMPVLLPHWSWGGVGWGSARPGQVRVGTLGAPIHFQWSLSQTMCLGVQHTSGSSVLGTNGPSVGWVLWAGWGVPYQSHGQANSRQKKQKDPQTPVPFLYF